MLIAGILAALLTDQDFSNGWKFFEYGLLTQAKGPQKWQRPFQTLRS